MRVQLLAANDSLFSWELWVPVYGGLREAIMTHALVQVAKQRNTNNNYCRILQTVLCFFCIVTLWYSGR